MISLNRYKLLIGCVSALITLLAGPVYAQTFQPFWDPSPGTDFMVSGMAAGVSPTQIATKDGTIYAASGADYTLTSLLRWTKCKGWELLANANGPVNALYINENENSLYVAGGFSAIGQLNARVAKLDLASGIWSPVGDDSLPAGLIQALCVDSAGRVYVGFWKAIVGGEVDSSELFVWNGSSWNTVGQGILTGTHFFTGVCHGISALATDGTNVVVAGDFDGAYNPNGNLVTSFSIILWNGTSWSTVVGDYTYFALDPNLPGYYPSGLPAIVSLAICNTNIFATGTFSGPGGGTAPLNLARFSLTGVPIPAPGLSGAFGVGRRLAVHNNVVYLCGNFTNLGDSPANGLAKFESETWSTIGSPASLSYLSGPVDVLGIAADDTAVAVTGWIDTVNSVSVSYFGRYVTGTDKQPSLANMVSWWRAEGDASDAVGTNVGTIGPNLTFATGEVGAQSFAFDGTNSYVSIQPSPTLNVGASPGFTIEGWIKPEGDISEDFSCLAEWNDGAGNLGAHLWLSQPTYYSGNGPGCLFLNLVDTHSSFHLVPTDANVVTSGVWQHIAVTYDQVHGIATIYHNGTIARQSNVGIFQPQTSYGLNFGKRLSYGSISGPYRGDMDEMSLYNRALSAGEIQAIYNAGSLGKCTPIAPTCTPVLPQLVSWWRAEGDYLDAQGTNNGTHGRYAGFTTGFVGAQSFDFGGFLSYVTIPPSTSLDVGAGSGFTLEGWIMPVGDIGQDFSCLAEWNNGSGGLGVHLWLSQPTEYSGGGPGSLFLNLVDSNFGFHTVPTDPNVVTSNIWQHVAVTYDKQQGIATIYRNGAIVAQQNVGTFQPQTSYGLNFGQRLSYGGIDGPYRGALDEMSLYNQALSADQIQAIYYAGSLGKCSSQ